MVVLVGLLFLIVSALVTVAAVMTNGGGGHPVGGAFTVFGQHMTGLSTGQLFLYGVVVGVIGMLGLSMLMGAFTRRLASSGARRELRGSRLETTAARADSDRLARQLDDERTERAEAETPAPAPSSSEPLSTRPGQTTAPLEQRPTSDPAPSAHLGIRQRLFHRADR